MSKPIFIAEVKTQSPFGWKSDKSWDELFKLAEKHGYWLSIHTDPRWGGSFDLIKKACALTKKPILAKGIHASDKDIEQAIACGADYVLVVGRVPKVHIAKCLLEPLSIAELKDYPQNAKVVWNQRDLATGQPKIELFEQARKTWQGWLAQASHIETVADVSKEAQAFIVGTHLPEFVRSLSA